MSDACIVCLGDLRVCAEADSDVNPNPQTALFTATEQRYSDPD